MRLNKQILALTLLIVSLLLGGCGGSVTPATGTPESSATNPTEQQVINAVTDKSPSGTEVRKINVYFPTNDAMYLEAEVRLVPKGSEPLRTALELLINGPENGDLIAIVPAGTILKNVWIKDHIAYVDFNDRLVKNNSGGSTSELLLVGAIVNTATEFPGVKGVRLLVDGKSINTIAGHVDVSETLERSEEMIKKHR